MLPISSRRVKIAADVGLGDQGRKNLPLIKLVAFIVIVSLDNK